VTIIRKLAMPSSTYRHYGTCHCGGVREARIVEVPMNTGTNQAVTLADVPQGACPQCGGRFYKPELLSRIEAVFKASGNDPVASVSQQLNR
jgi:YgiT-type zinc finger domain-containing protein